MAQQAKKSDGGGNKTFLILGGIVLAGGLGWLLMAGRVGGAMGPLPTPEEFEALSAEVAADPSVGIGLGAESAPIQIDEFIDYSCPHCATFAGFAGKLLRQNYVEMGDGLVRWVTYDYVLGTFPNSVPAAMAARCAGDQGRYWPMHDLLFSRQLRWYGASSPQDEFAEIAEMIGLDRGTFNECMSDSRHLEEIAASRKLGNERGVGSTPTIFLDGVKLDLTTSDPYSYIEGLIKAKLAALSGEGEPTASSDDSGGSQQ